MGRLMVAAMATATSLSALSRAWCAIRCARSGGWEVPAPDVTSCAATMARTAKRTIDESAAVRVRTTRDKADAPSRASAGRRGRLALLTSVTHCTPVERRQGRNLPRNPQIAGLTRVQAAGVDAFPRPESVAGVATAMPGRCSCSPPPRSATERTLPRVSARRASGRGVPGPGIQIVTTGQVMVRVMPSICCMSRTTMRPSSFMDAASARAITS
jgi:hypothetical protein